MNVLITGGAGYIGSHTALEFLENSCNVTIVDNLENGKKFLIPKKAEFLEADISDEFELNNLFKEKKIDIVVHLAAYTKVAESIQNPEKYYDNNYKKSKKFFDICIKNKAKRFIFSSTGAVYGNLKNSDNLKEDDRKKPLNAYSDSKLKTENYLTSIYKENSLKILTLRYFNVAGSDKKLRSGLITNPDNLIKAICEYIVGKRKSFFINGNDYNTKDGTTVRDFIHVSDLANIHYVMSKKLMNINNSFYDDCNCGYGKGFSILEVINEFEKIIKKKLDFKVGTRRKGDAEITVANVEKLFKEYNWKPSYDNLNKILQSALKWEKKIKL